MALGMALALPQMAVAKDGKGGPVVSDAVPLEHWALPRTMGNVRLSPDGKYLAYIRNQSKKGEPLIEVLEVDNLKGEPYRIGAKSMEINGFDWISPEDMTISFSKQVSKKIKGFNQGAFKSKLARFSMDDKKFDELTDDNTSITLQNSLVDEPNHVLMRYSKYERGQSRRAPNYYKVNLKSGARELVLKGSQEFTGYGFDKFGNPRVATSRTNDNQYTLYHHRPVGGSGWTEFARHDRDSFETFSFVGLVEGSPNEVYVLANNGHDKVGLWKYNIQTKSFGQMVYRRNDVDLQGVGYHSNDWANPDTMAYIAYSTDKGHRKYMDAEEQAIYNQFMSAVPNAHSLQLSSRSKDGKKIIVFNSGPKDPGTYYFYNDGEFKKVGSANSLITAKDLNPVEYITYTARDGMKIHGYVTKPKGSGPHPLVVMPHGGPFVDETPSYDPWAQMFANNGYVVLQPQYRGSKKYGLDYYQAGFIDGGQGGFKMQDDKDDGAQYLVDQGLVDPDRMAMMGFSYGGYASLIAASRSPNIYQCVIAGAAVSDNMLQVNRYRNAVKGALKEEQLKFWDGSINPIKEVENVNVPMLVFHGSVDQRVEVKHAKKYIDDLKKHGKNYEYVELKGADHGGFKYEHMIKIYPKMIDYLQNDCGPDGL